MNLGDKLKQARLESKLSRKKLADMVGVTLDAIVKIENGDRNPSFDLVSKISTVLNISLDSLR